MLPQSLPSFAPKKGNDTFAFERELARQGYCRIAGVDEVGRGPLAGPVVAACVILPTGCDYSSFKDSKQLSHTRREKLLIQLREIGALIGIGEVDEDGIDRLNILKASLLAMQRAVESLSVQPDFLLVDGKFSVPITIAQQPIVKGDCLSASIAAASIVAKVTRDAMMDRYHEHFPLYRFDRHKGYPTAEHRRLLQEYGPCRIHRRSFRGVAECVTEPL